MTNKKGTKKNEDIPNVTKTKQCDRKAPNTPNQFSDFSPRDEKDNPESIKL